MEKENKTLLRVKNLEVKFRVRDRILTAIRGISLDIYDEESIAIVGESGSGKSVFTKTFAGMLDDNGFISNGAIIFRDEELAETYANKSKLYKFFFYPIISKKMINLSKYFLASNELLELASLKKKIKEVTQLTDDENNKFDKKFEALNYERSQYYNLLLTYDRKTQKSEISEAKAKIKECDSKIDSLTKEKKEAIRLKNKLNGTSKQFIINSKNRINELNKIISQKLTQSVSEESVKESESLAKEVYLSIARYPLLKRIILASKLLILFKRAAKEGKDLNDRDIRNPIFDKVAFRVKYIDETEEKLHGRCILNLAKVNYTKDWQQIRGRKIATVFQDPMTSLNPIITIGKQISSIIMKHQGVSEAVARQKAVELMMKVGIPDAENRYDDYPYQYSGGMRQRIVIAIALSCQPKILICDEPTTALDVTIQAQILKLIKDLQKEFHYTIVFITHDLGVVANIADRVAVLYAGQIVEVGTVKEVFYDPRHPYTWALLSSLPQLAQKGEILYSIAGTPPSLYNKIKGDPFAPRNPYCLKIDTLMDSPMFKVTDTHYAKTWLLDPRSPKVEKPKGISNIHDVLMKAFNVSEVK